jgi:hypothetical protein
VIEASDFSTADVRLVDLADPTGPPRAITERKQDRSMWSRTSAIA